MSDLLDQVIEPLHHCLDVGVSPNLLASDDPVAIDELVSRIGRVR